MKKRNHTLEYYHKTMRLKMDEHDTSNETKKDPEIKGDPEKKYPALRLIARLYKILGFSVPVIAILAIFFSAVILLGGDDPLGWIIILVSVFIGPIVLINMFALSESIMIFIDMADNLSKIKEDIGEDLSEIKRRLADKSD